MNVTGSYVLDRVRCDEVTVVKDVEMEGNRKEVGVTDRILYDPL